MEEKILNILVEMDKRLTDEIKKLNQKIDEVDKKIENVKKEILDRQFAFEHEYGIKIDAIFDAVRLEMDKNIEKSQRLYNLAERINKNEVTIFNHEERISKLELKQQKST